MSFPRHLCLATLLLGLPSCTYLENKFGGMMPSLSKKSPEDKRIGQAKVIGVIELVNPEQNYVLINCEQRVDIPPGTEIISQGVNGTNARLRVTPERKGNYITADIVQGTPVVRELVVYQVKPGEVPASAPTTTTPQGVVVPMTPVMQPDVIPPLNAPYQPMAPVAPTFVPAPVPQPRQQVAPAPAPPLPDSEPPSDLSKLPPVIR